MNKNFIPHDDQEFYNWAENFRTKLNEFAGVLGLIQKIEAAIPAATVQNVAQGPFSDEMAVKLENTGATSTISFCLSATAAGACTPPNQMVVGPGLTVDTTIGALGGAAGNNYLNASNQFGAGDGSYRITLAASQVMQVNAQAGEVQQKILQTTQARNEWKQAAEDKNIQKSAFIKDTLRPFIQNKIKASDSYTVAIGKAMGIVEETPAVDPAAMKPVIKALPDAGAIDIIWKKGQADAIRIEVDRNDTRGFVLVGIDTQPDYRDTSPLPVAPTVWKYRAIYIIKDEIVGQWSDTVQITVVK